MTGKPTTAPAPKGRISQRDPTDSMTGGDFAARRARIGWTQKQAAEALGLALSQIGHIENGRSSVTPSVARLLRLYRFGDIPRRPQGISEE